MNKNQKTTHNKKERKQKIKNNKYSTKDSRQKLEKEKEYRRAKIRT